MPSPPSIPQRVALAETIVVGKVTFIEGQSIMMAESPGSKEREHFVASVHVEESLMGAEGLTDLKVAFPAQPMNRLEFDGGSNDYLLQLETDQEVCLFLKPHHAGEFLVGASDYPSLNKKNPTFESNWKLTQKCAKLIANPELGLEAKETDDRFLTAAMLILRHRTQSFMSKGQPKQVPIDAKQSRLILQALAEADWQKPKADLDYDMRPDTLFGRLNLTSQDGWNQAVSPEAAKKWLKEHVENYRIKKYVIENR
jgi:hypothetical protein